MANKDRGEISLKVDGKTYTLCFDVNALCEVEDLLGRGIPHIMADMQSAETMRFGTVRGLLWGALQRHHPEMTVKMAGEMVSAVKLDKAMAAIGDALNASNPDEDEPGNA